MEVDGYFVYDICKIAVWFLIWFIDGCSQIQCYVLGVYIFFIGFNCDLLCLKILHISFLIASTCLGDFVQVASPSSLYNPTLTSRWVSWDNKNSLTSSQVYAPSKLPIVRSKSGLILRHGMLLL